MNLNLITYNALVKSIRTGNSEAIEFIRNRTIPIIGIAEYTRLYKQAFMTVNSTQYKFIDFNTQVFDETAE